MYWYLWIGVGIIALIGELLSSGLFLASFAVSALIVAPLALLLPLAAQLTVFAVLSLTLLAVARPALLPFLQTSGPGEEAPRIGPSSDRATAVGLIDHLNGQIRIGNGEFWTARALEPGMIIRPEREVEIVRLDGLIARVRAVEPAVLAADIPTASFGLSVREVEVLELVALGLSNQEIADRLVLSPRTVHHHVSHIFDKMGVENRVEAVRLAMDRRIINRDSSP
jgi:DNA-binding CsgD family transcriptional regulator/membrane protein implicated in regulation of membrane protease activity